MLNYACGCYIKPPKTEETATKHPKNPPDPTAAATHINGDRAFQALGADRIIPEAAPIDPPYINLFFLR